MTLAILFPLIGLRQTRGVYDVTLDAAFDVQFCRWIFNNRSRGLGFIIRNTFAAVAWVSSSETQFDSSYFQGLYAGFLTFWCAGVVEFGAYRLWDVLPFRVNWYFRFRRKLIPLQLRPDHWYNSDSESDSDDDSDSDSDSDYLSSPEIFRLRLRC